MKDLVIVRTQVRINRSADQTGSEDEIEVVDNSSLVISEDVKDQAGDSLKMKSRLQTSLQKSKARKNTLDKSIGEGENSEPRVINAIVELEGAEPSQVSHTLAHEVTEEWPDQ